jgi:hypothetical protein
LFKASSGLRSIQLSEWEGRVEPGLVINDPFGPSAFEPPAVLDQGRRHAFDGAPMLQQQRPRALGERLLVVMDTG